MSGPLAGLRAVILTSTLPGAYVGQFLADFGAEVIYVEPPGGTALRQQTGWPMWGRGTKSIVVDLHDPADVEVARKLATGADVVFEAFRPGVTERLGVGYDDLAEGNPGLIYGSLTGFGRTGPYTELQGYEAIVLAKMGYLGGALGPPAMAVVPSATFCAAQLALQGIFAALFERERSGRGQRVDTSAVQGLSAHDTWNWMIRHVAAMYPEALAESAGAVAPPGTNRPVPMSWVQFGLLVGVTADGRWLQFAHATTRGLNAFLRALGLGWTIDDPHWKEGPYTQDVAMRDEFWGMMLEGVRAKTTEEWQAAFDADTNVFAEIFRRGTEVLHHPQMLHDGQVIEVADPERGTVRQPGPMVKMAATPGDGTGPVPSLDEHGAALRAEAPRIAPPGGATTPDPATSRLPLDGVTIVEFGTFYAAPYGASLLADLGARVIKLEQLDGDPIRFQVGMPEVGGVRVTQGKESVAVDINVPEGRQIALELVRRADVVLRSFRGGVAERMGYDDKTLLEVNPNLVYLNAPGFGVHGPYADRPAYAPVIGAGSGFQLRNTARDFPDDPDLTLDQIKDAALAGFMGGAAHADGFSALGVGTAMALGLVTRARNGGGGQSMLTTMMSTMAHALSESVLEYDGRPEPASIDPDRRGFGPLYRIYDTAQGYVILAAPTDREWSDLVAALGTDSGLRAFADAGARRARPDALRDALQAVFSTRTAAAWEKELTAAGVACVELVLDANTLMNPGGLASQLGMATEVVHPLFGPHLRMGPMVSLSRSGGRAGPGALIGEHTDAVLTELGYDGAKIADLRERGVIG